MNSAQRCLFALLVGMTLAKPGGLPAQAEPEAPAIRRVYVPKDDPESWPKGNWTPLRSERLKELKSGFTKADQRNAAGWFQKANYSATFLEGNLIDGHIRLELEPDRLSSESPTRYAPWNDVNLACSHISWENQIAELGSTASGRSLLVIPPGVSELRGDWSFAGRKLSSGHHFRLKLPPAAVSVMEIFVPADRELVLPQKQPVRHSFDSERGIRRYEISLGSTSNVEFLVISTPNGSSKSSNRGLYSHADASFVLSRDEFQFQQELNLESLGAPRSEISIPIPEGFEIRSVEWGGAAIESWVVTDVKPNSLKISLPSPLLGSSRPLRIRGIASFSLDRELAIPRLVPEDSISLSEEVSLSVSLPLELKSIDHSGYRQVPAPPGPDGSSVLVFQRLDLNPTLRFRVGQPESRIQASLLTQLERRRGRFLAESHVLLRMSTGSTFQLGMQVAPGWEPVQIELIPEANSSRVSRVSWQLSEGNQGRRRLDIDLPRSLSRGHPVQLRLTSRSLTADAADFLLPLLQFDDSIRAEHRLLVSRDTFSSTDFDSLEEWSRTSSSELPAEFAQTRSRKALDLQPDKFLLYFSDSHSESRLLIPEPTFEYEIHVTDRILEQIDRTTEEVQIGIVIPEGSKPVSNLILTCTEQTQNLPWELIDRPDIDVNVKSEAVQMPNGRTQVVLEFVPPIQNSATLAVRRAIEFQAASSRQFQALLPFSPESSRFTGTVSFQSEFAGGARVDRQLEAVGLKAKPNLNAEHEKNPWSADYNDETARLRILPNDPTAVREPAEVYLELDSILMNSASSEFLHRLKVHLPADVQQLAFQFPNVEYSVFANGVPAVPIVGPDKSSANLIWKSPVSSSSIVTFEYRSNAARSWDRLNSTIPIPEIGAGKTYFRWTVFLPPGVHPTTVSQQVRPNTPRFDPLITRRLFGPVGRNRADQFFDPRSRGKWSQVLSRESEIGHEDALGLPAGSSRYRFSSNRLPTTLTASFWSESDQIPLSWGVLISTVLVISLLRITEHSARIKVASWWFLLVAVLAIFAPPRCAMYSGALFCGSLVSVLIPRSLLLGRKILEQNPTEAHTPSGSTISKMAVTGTLAICLTLGGSHSAQEPQVESSGDELIDILIPYRDAKEPANSTPEFVYVRERDRPRLDLAPKNETESNLITSIDYHCRIPLSGLVELQAVCQIHLPAGESTTEVVIPIQGANLAAENACLVDGHPAPVSLTKDGFPLIELTPDTVDDEGNRIEAPLRAPRTGEIDRQPQTRVVILNLYPPIDTAQNGTGFSLTVPRVPIGSILCEYPPEASSRIKLLGARGEVMYERPGILSATLGDVDRWEIRIQPEIVLTTQPKVETQTQLFLTAQPAYLRYRYRISHRVLEGNLNYLTWVVPPEFDLLRIRGEGILRYSIQEDSGTRRLYFDLENPLTFDSGSLIIEGEFLSSARRSTEEETHVGIPNLFPSPSTPTDHYENSVEYASAGLLVGLSSPPELPLTIVEQQKDRLRSVDPKLFLPEWPEDARLQKPEYCFEANAPAELKCLFTLVRPSREVSVIEQGLISDRTFDWTWTGEISTSDSPVFEHQFRVDPRLEILSISVKEDQAERDHQWFREGDRLTVRLGRKTEALQTLTIRGQMPLDAGRTLAFPNFRLLEAEYLNSEFDVYRTNRWIVSSEQGDSLTAEDDETAYDERERVLVGRYSDREENPIPPVVLTRKTSPVFAQNTVTLRKRSDGDFDITAEMHLSNLSTDPIVLLVPEAWAARFTLEAGTESENEPDLETLSDGSVRATVPVDEGSRTIAVRSTMTPPPDEVTWELSLPAFEGNVEKIDRLLVRAADGWLPSEDCGVSITDSNAETLNSSAPPKGYEEYSIKCDPLKLIRANRADSRAVPKIPMLLEYLSVSSGKPISGRWFLLYEGRGLSELDLNVPMDLTEFRCRLNGMDVATNFDPKERHLTIPFPSGLTAAVIEISWSSSAVPEAPLIQKLSIEGPAAVEVPIERRELVLMTDSDRRIAMFDGMTVHSIESTRLALLEEISMLLEGAVEANEDVPRFLPLLMNGLIESVVGETAPSLTETQLERLRKLDLSIPHATSPLHQTLELGQFSWAYPELLSGSELPGVTSIHASLPVDESSITQTWMISRSWLTVFGTILACLLALPLLRLIFRSNAGEWLSQHRAVSYLGLGLLWWFCLEFSLVGLLMAGIAMLSILWRTVHPQPNVVVRKS